MDVACSAFGFIGLERPKDGIRKLTKGGFSNVSLDFGIGFHAGALEHYGEEEYEQDENYKDFDEIWRELRIATDEIRQGGMDFPIARAPYLGRYTKRTDLNGVLTKLTLECIDYCGQIGCKSIVVCPIFAGIERADRWSANHDFYIQLGRAAINQGVMILLINQVDDFNGHIVRGICSDAYEAAKWVDDLNAEIGSECFGFCMDVGVCNLCCQNMRDFAVVLGKRIKAVLLYDCDGLSDNRQLPYTCTSFGKPQTDWLGFFRGLRKSYFDGTIIMEFYSSYYGFPLQLQPQFLMIAKQMGDYFKWQLDIENVLRKYDKRVLFGAGNMCRNYMKCYGKEFRPLYTCDNNSSIWGSTFEGLEVKSPNELKNLPSDCAIFICNVYYEEIMKQLLEMGINNPIEYFNDEYMPSTYLDRFDSTTREVR